MRDVAQLLAAAVLVLGLGWLVYDWQFGPADAGSLAIEDLRGDVALELPGRSLAPLVGLQLTGAERLVTGGEGSRVVLSLGESSRVTLEARSTVRVLGSSGDGVELELEHGRVRAHVRPEDGQLGVRAAGRTVRSRDAAFALGVGRDGTTELQVGSGEVALEGFDGIEGAIGGQRVVAGSAAARLEPIPTSLLLQVAWPDARTRKERVRVAGDTDPGASVKIITAQDTHNLIADGQGHFEVALQLVEGDNEVEVEVTSLLGGETTASWRVTRDSQGPTGVFEVRY